MTDIGTAGSSLHLTDCTATQMPGVRRWLRRHMPDTNRRVDAELVATELVANAIDHGDGAHAVRITVTPGRVHIEVDDGHPFAIPTVGRSRLGGPRGNGLTIVDAVATWGVARTDAGKTVWAHL